MSAAQPLDFSGSSSHSRTSVDALKHLFSTQSNEREFELVESNQVAQTEEAESTTSVDIEQSDFAPTQDPQLSIVDRIEVSNTNSIGESPAGDAEIYSQPTFDTLEQSEGSNTKITRTDLVNVLEGFVSLIKNSDDLSSSRVLETTRQQLTFDPAPMSQRLTVHVDDKTAEVEELRCLLVEAQETIIKLLTDRVDDRAKIAALETELKLLPDLQAQADRAIAVAMNTDDFRRELTKVKFELERVRLSKVRHEIERNRRSIWGGVRGWFFKRKDQIVFPPPESEPPSNS